MPFDQDVLQPVVTAPCECLKVSLREHVECFFPQRDDHRCVRHNPLSQTRSDKLFREGDEGSLKFKRAHRDAAHGRAMLHLERQVTADVSGDAHRVIE
jgi:hypothetical protein